MGLLRFLLEKQMATVQHSALTDPNLHEPKGVSTAAANQVYVANGSGSGTWKDLSPVSLAGLATNGTSGTLLSVDGAGNFVFVAGPHGQCDFYDSTLAAPYALAGTTSFQKLAPNTTGGGVPALMTEGTNARLTYTGSTTVRVTFTYNVSLSIGSSAKDVTLALYKNGSVINAHSVSSVSSSGKVVMSGTTGVSVSTNDYVEVYAKISSNDTINVYSFQLNAFVSGA